MNLLVIAQKDPTRLALRRIIHPATILAQLKITRLAMIPRRPQLLTPPQLLLHMQPLLRHMAVVHGREAVATIAVFNSAKLVWVSCRLVFFCIECVLILNLVQALDHQATAQDRQDMAQARQDMGLAHLAPDTGRLRDQLIQTLRLRRRQQMASTRSATTSLGIRSYRHNLVR